MSRTARYLFSGAILLALSALEGRRYVASPLSSGIIAAFGCLGHTRLAHFYCDCTKVMLGETLASASLRMNRYTKLDVPNWETLSVENAEERAARKVFIPSSDHTADFCVLYPDADGIIQRKAALLD